MASSPHSSSPFHHLLVFFLLFAAATAFPVTSDFELGIQKRIHFRVYFHETFLGPDNTTVTVSEEASLIPLVLVFTEGEFANSTLTAIGRLDASGKAERAIVGGTGVFQYAWGKLASELLTSSVEGLVAAFDVYVIYYNDVRLSTSP
ncbi:hypothetical protein B296_00056637 [Ensete ventricosum]|uniref:Dirigent protein n=1 Tax=Ensete ventricosum TaxID=4639 RepID=A0A426XDD7_ENSVE|nr:hypothetical protein B296_00056637 [Ensete ventricosum]